MVRELVGESSEPVHSTYFTRRLEAFNDVVFGLTLSTLATFLTRIDFDKPERASIGFALFMLTFALIASIWYSSYLTFHFAFVGERLDVLLNFVLLAFSVLTPFTLQRMMFSGTLATGYSRFEEYAVVFGVVYFISGLLKLRGLKRFGNLLEPKVQLKVFRSAAIGASAPLAVGITILLLPRIGYSASFAFVLFAVVGIAVRRAGRIPAIFLPAAAEHSA